ncbi:MAG: DUF4397 domain-containing protein [Cellulosilyticum sp.]|nr:DUF4397 domain-containing protein [Cellulosilyticum sp.]
MKTPTPNTSYLRLFHALPTAESFDIYLDEVRYCKDFLYEDFTPYKPLSAGEHLLTLTAHQSTEPLYSRTFWISEQKIYTLVLSYLPNTSDYQGYLINDPPKTIPEEHLLIRVANFSQHLAPLCMHLVDIKPIFKKIPLRQTSGYLSFLPTTADIELLEVDGQNVLLTKPSNLFKITRYYTLYIVGGTEDHPLKCIQTIDGNSFIHFNV